MNKYAQAALLAVERMANDSGVSPNEAWEEATMKIFGPGPSQKKGCPKGAFLGLCEEGLIKGVPKGKYTSSVLNKGYAIKAAALCGTGKSAQTWGQLWAIVTGNNGKSHNAQMDIVIALKEAELLT